MSPWLPTDFILYLTSFFINLPVALGKHYIFKRYKSTKKILGVTFFMVFLLAVYLFSPQLRVANDNGSNEEVAEIGVGKSIEHLINEHPKKSCFAIAAIEEVEQQ